MIAIIAICFTVGLMVLLSNLLKLLGQIIVVLLKYVVGPGLIIYCVLYIMLHGL